MTPNAKKYSANQTEDIKILTHITIDDFIKILQKNKLEVIPLKKNYGLIHTKTEKMV